MNLKIKNFNWLAGRPVVLLNDKTARKLNVHVDERVLIKKASKKAYAVVDIFPKAVSSGEIGLSQEVSNLLKLKNKTSVDVMPAEVSYSGQLIKRKIAGERLSKEDFKTLIKDISKNNLTEVEVAYFVASEKLKGMSSEEIYYLTKAMADTGEKLKFKTKIVADKHCIGGIAGNRTTPIVVAICASAGLLIPKNSSRAITSASGTADVIETISNVNFNTKQIKKIVQKTSACLVWGGSLGLAPSDDEIIHVEKVIKLDVEPQLIASIMAKKIAAGSNHLLIDIPYGNSAKIKTKSEARKLAKKFQKLAKKFQIKLKVLLTNGEKPIGKGVGPILEMLDILSVLKNEQSCPQDLKNKSLLLTIKLMKLCKIKNAKKLAKEILESGRAYEKFKHIINTQNNQKIDSDDFEKRISKLKLAKYLKEIKSPKNGKIIELNNKKINDLARVLGTPQTKSAGVYLHKGLEKVKKGEKILTIYSESKDKLIDAMKFINNFKPFTIK